MHRTDPILDSSTLADVPIPIRSMPKRITSKSPINRKFCLVSFTSRENTASNRTQYPAGSAE
jgi:hypothetical protein